MWKNNNGWRKDSAAAAAAAAANNQAASSGLKISQAIIAYYLTCQGGNNCVYSLFDFVPFSHLIQKYSSLRQFPDVETFHLNPYDGSCSV